MSEITDFYKGKIPDIHGRMLRDIQKWDYVNLEEVHSYIQWLFPLNEESNYNSLAPILTDEDLVEFQNSDDIRGNLLTSFNAILSFYGFILGKSDGIIIINRAENFEERSLNWLTAYNHNFLRITRILKCLMLVGLDNYAFSFFETLKKLYDTDYKNTIGEVTYKYWENAKTHTEAVNRTPRKPMKIVFCTLPISRELIKGPGKVEGNPLIQYDGEVAFAVNAVLARTLKKDERAKIVLLSTHDADGNYIKYRNEFMMELHEINNSIGAKILGPDFIEMPFKETKEMFSETLRQIISCCKDNAEIIADVTFGPKLLPVILFYALRFSEKFFNTNIKYIVYRKIDFRKPNPENPELKPEAPVIFDVTSFYYLNSLSEVMECESSSDAVKMLNTLLDV
jgi:hypothetical protein